jgi:hypothetical protein
MITPTTLIYSKASALRLLAKMLGDIIKFVETIRKLANGAWQITYRTTFGRCSLIISAALFKRHFVDRRREEARHLYTNKVKDNWFRVVNPKKGTAYDCYAYQDSIDCTCEDYHNQVKFLKKGCCKHGYSVLSYLGFSSLSEYIDNGFWLNDEHPPFPEDDF